jgi:hypothetical protein
MFRSKKICQAQYNVLGCNSAFSSTSTFLVFHNLNFISHITGSRMCTVVVRELMGWVRNVVLMNVCLDLENPGGSGFRVGGYMSQVRKWGS